MFVEMRALHKSERWEVDDLPSGKKPVGCKWVFKILYKTNSSIERCKMRLVAKEKTQIFSNGYQFAPMTKMNSIRILLSLPANFVRNLFLFDIKKKKFHGKLEEEVYMDFQLGNPTRRGCVQTKENHLLSLGLGLSHLLSH